MAKESKTVKKSAAGKEPLPKVTRRWSGRTLARAIKGK